MIDIESAVQWQYDASPTIKQIVKNMNGYIDPRANLQQFYDVVWNLETAQGFGLDIWGKIVGVGRYLKIEGQKKPFGFSQSEGCYPFNEGVFYTKGSTQTYALTDTAYRSLIYTKALSNISRTTSPAINQILSKFFVGKKAFVLDLGGMRMRYVFRFKLSAYERAVVKFGNVFPRPSGVTIEVLELPVDGIFGFGEAGGRLQGFNHGVFLPEGSFYYAT